MTDAELKAAITAVELVGPSYSSPAERFTGQVTAAHVKELNNLFRDLPQLRKAAETLDALYAAGVDNWEGYAAALDMLGT